MPRVVDKDLVGSRVPTRQCALNGCNAYTRERKPYCSDHILVDGYAKELSEKIQVAEDEIEEAARRGPKVIDIHGLVVEEILAGIAHCGQVTWPRLIKDHVVFFNGVNPKTTVRYLERLLDEGLVAIRGLHRRYEVVELTPKGLRATQGKI